MKSEEIKESKNDNINIVFSYLVDNEKDDIAALKILVKFLYEIFGDEPIPAVFQIFNNVNCDVMQFLFDHPELAEIKGKGKGSSLGENQIKAARVILDRLFSGLNKKNIVITDGSYSSPYQTLPKEHVNDYTKKLAEACRKDGKRGKIYLYGTCSNIHCLQVIFALLEKGVKLEEIYARYYIGSNLERTHDMFSKNMKLFVQGSSKDKLYQEQTMETIVWLFDKIEKHQGKIGNKNFVSQLERFNKQYGEYIGYLRYYEKNQTKIKSYFKVEKNRMDFSESFNKLVEPFLHSGGSSIALLRHYSPTRELHYPMNLFKQSYSLSITVHQINSQGQKKLDEGLNLCISEDRTIRIHNVHQGKTKTISIPPSEEISKKLIKKVSEMCKVNKAEDKFHWEPTGKLLKSLLTKYKLPYQPRESKETSSEVKKTTYRPHDYQSVVSYAIATGTFSKQLVSSVKTVGNLLVNIEDNIPPTYKQLFISQLDEIDDVLKKMRLRSGNSNTIIESSFSDKVSEENKRQKISEEKETDKSKSVGAKFLEVYSIIAQNPGNMKLIINILDHVNSIHNGIERLRKDFKKIENRSAGVNEFINNLKRKSYFIVDNLVSTLDLKVMNCDTLIIFPFLNDAAAVIKEKLKPEARKHFDLVQKFLGSCLQKAFIARGSMAIEVDRDRIDRTEENGVPVQKFFLKSSVSELQVLYKQFFELVVTNLLLKPLNETNSVSQSNVKGSAQSEINDLIRKLAGVVSKIERIKQNSKSSQLLMSSSKTDKTDKTDKTSNQIIFERKLSSS